MELLEEVNITPNIVGTVIQDKKLYLTHKNQKEILFDFNKEKIMGIREEIS
jgi:selenophosphate synthetase-related protein